MAEIVVTSDLHIGITNERAVERLIDDVIALKPDAIVVAGDLGEPMKDFVACLDLLAPATCPVGILAGNHDLWIDDQNAGVDSAEYYYKRLPAAVRQRGFVWLEEDPLRLPDGVAIAGSVAWYDYSRRAAQYNNWRDDQFAKAKYNVNQDAKYIKWQYSDPEFARIVGDKLIHQLTELEEDRNIRDVLVATHIPIHPSQFVPMPADNPVADVFFGNLTLGNRVGAFRKVTAIVSGHTHRGVVPTVLGSLTVATIASDYHAPDFVRLVI